MNSEIRKKDAAEIARHTIFDLLLDGHEPEEIREIGKMIAGYYWPPKLPTFATDEKKTAIEG